MLMPLCNYLGMMLVGLLPDIKLSKSSNAKPTETELHDETEAVRLANPSLVLRRQTTNTLPPELETPEPTESSSTGFQISDYASTLQLCVLLNVLFDFMGCIFSNVGLSMAGSGIYQVVYSSVVCWSALMSRVVLKKLVRRDEWIGIATVTFGLAFSALGESNGGKNAYVILIGSLNTFIGAGFYGTTYVAGEFTLNLPEKPTPRALCIKIGTTCVGIIAVYMTFYVLPNWNELVTEPIQDAKGSSSAILIGLVLYTISQLAHGFTYFMMLGSLGAVATGVMQSLRAVLVFAFSSIVFCSRQESQCFDTRRGVSTLVVVVGVLYYSWAKSQSRQAVVSKFNKLVV